MSEQERAEHTGGPPVSEQNIERLVGRAYQPEAPGGEFAQAVKQRMQAEVAMNATMKLDAAAVGDQRERVIPHPMNWERLAWVATAVAAIVVIAVLLNRKGPPNLPQQPQLARVPGGEDRKAGSGGAGPSLDALGLTARAREKAPGADPVSVGSTITTKAGEKCRVTLPDGSTLYVNQNTVAKLDAERRVTLERGEVFIEVSPRDKGAAGEPTFVVKAGNREVKALGTKFAVTADKALSGVFVTQGKVQVDQVGEVKAGQRLIADKAAIEPAPRASAALGWIADLMAAAESPLVPKSKFEGGALVVVDPWGQESRLTLRKFNVDVHVEDGFARTTIDQTYFNHENRRQEGTFYFPLPADASLSRLAMYVGENLMEGGMAEREHAAAVYETIVYSQRDPALLEWLDGSTFKMRVFPLEPRQEKRILMEYVQKLPEQYARTDYRFPAGHNLGVVRDWSFTARVKNGAAAHWASDTHELAAATEAGDLVLSSKLNHIKVDEDVVVRVMDPTRMSLGESSSWAMASNEIGRFLMLRYRPHLAAAPVRERRDWVVVFEASGNRDPVLARAQVDIIKTMLQNAEHEDTFSIVTAGTRTRVLWDQARPATPENVAEAVALLEQTHLIGALDLGKAFEAAAPLVAAARNPYLVHVGAGVATLGERQPDELAKRIPQGAKYVGVGVGKSWSRPLMKTAAGRTGGYFTQINPDEPITWRAFELVSTLNTPRLLDIRVEDEDGKALFLAHADSLAHGEELVAVARCAEMPKAVTVKGTVDGKPFERKVEVAARPRENAGYLPRFWAKLEIDRLLADGAEKNKAKIIELSKSAYVMSPFTSLLVLETEKMYEEFKVDRGRKDHWAMFPAPAKIPVVYEPDPRQPVWSNQRPAATVDKNKKRKPEEVLETILVRIPPRALYWPDDHGHHYGGQALTAGQSLTRSYMVEDFSGWDSGVMPGGGGFGGGFLGDRREDFFAQGLARFTTDFDLDGTVTFTGGSGRLNKWAERNELFARDDRGKSRLQGMGKSMSATPANRPAAREPRSRFGGDRGAMPRGWIEVGRRFESDEMLDRLSAARGPAVLRSKQNARDKDGGIRQLGQKFKSDAKKEISLAKRELFGSRSGSQGRGLSLADAESASVLNGRVSGRMMSGYGGQGLLYRSPSFSGDHRVFGDLLQYAPGMNTTFADILAVLEAEAEADPGAAPGTIDPKARELIEKARARGWETVKIAGDDGEPAYTVTIDGSGRYAWQRELPSGLTERVVCDGTTLWHLYPGIGVGSSRKVAAAHRAELNGLIPWWIAPADELAVGADVVMAGDRTVAIVPKNVGAPATQPATQPVTDVHLHLVFGEDGRLIEQRAVEAPGGKVLARQTYAADGTIKLFDETGKETESLKYERTAAAEAPSLAPDADKLVVLPLPYRTWEHTIASRGLQDDGQFNGWKADDLLAAIASNMAAQRGNLPRLIGVGFFNKNDLRIGFYTLLLATGQGHNLKTTHDIGWNQKVTFNPEQDAAGTPYAALAKYIVEQSKVQQQGMSTDLPVPADAGDKLVNNLARLRYLYARMTGGRFNNADEARKNADRKLAVELVRDSRDPLFGWSVLTLLQNYGHFNQDLYREMADAVKKLEKVSGFAYAARYEQAKMLSQAGQQADARKIFEEIYAKALEADELPPIDYYFRNAFHQDDASRERFTQIIRDAAAKLSAKAGRPAAVYLAWQMYQVGEQPLAEDLMGVALADLPKEQRLSTTLAAIEYLWHSGQQARADKLIEPLLEDEKYKEYSELWRIAGAIAQQRGMLARSLACQEKAIDLDYQQMPEVVDLQWVRSDYGNLMAQYQRLADAVATLEKEPPKELLARTIRAADRWRAIDPDDTQACQYAAAVLRRLGAVELAWDYLTTPLADKPNEAAPWQSMAQQLKQQGDFDLADKAYATAYELETTNAQLLWERAQLLQQTQKHEEARKLYRQIADGKWQPRFQWIQQQARNYAR